MKKQIVVIQGGHNFDTYKEYMAFLNNYKIDIGKLKTKRWKENLAERLGKDFQVISPKMPNSMNAKYKEWKIMFEKLFPFLRNNLILLGHSLGGIFLAKYLSENKFPKKILATFLIAAPYDRETRKKSLADFILPKSLNKFQAQGGNIFLYHSKDDPVVPFVSCKKYKNVLPEAEAVIFKNKGHFDQTEFPEIVKNIKNL